MSEKLNSCLQLHRDGMLKEAEQCYKDLLMEDPSNANAHNLIALIYNTLGDNRRALHHANHAVALVRDPLFLCTRGKIFTDTSKFREAISDLNESLKKDPNNADSENNLSVVYRQSGDLKKAIQHAILAIEKNSQFALGWVNLAAAYQLRSEMQLAKESYQKALAINPEIQFAKENISKVYYELGEFSEAAEIFQELINKGRLSIDLTLPYIHILSESGEIYKAANVLINSFRYNQSFAELNHYLSQDIFFAVVVRVCSYLSEVLGKKDEAMLIYSIVLNMAPSVSHAALVNIGKIYFDLRQYDDAIASFRKALKAEPRSQLTELWALTNLGVCLISKGESKEAIKSFEEALLIDPSFVPAAGWLLKEKGHICDWDNYDQVVTYVRSLVGTERAQPIAPFTSLSVYEEPADLLFWARLSTQAHFRTVASQAGFQPLNNIFKNRKIRIGYYSFDFRNHPVAHLTGRLFEVHDHEQFDIYAYSYGPDDGSEARKRIANNVKSFVDVKDMSLIQTAERIREDEIDFLIDLTGNTLHNRSEVIALRPAKLHAHWLGFIGTMGNEFYDYIIADDTVAPLGDELYFSEKILRLPHGFHIMDDTRRTDILEKSRREYGLPEGSFVFGCFCQTFKIQPKIFKIWLEVLKRVPHGVLWLASGPSGAIDNLRRYAEEGGVDPSRIIVAERCEMEEYLARYKKMDLYLDTFPYTSGTQASDALYMGCPLISMRGKTMASRMSTSILKQVSLGELSVDSENSYVNLAVELASEGMKLDQIRSGLLQKRDSGKLFDAKKIVEGLEQAIVSVVK